MFKYQHRANSDIIYPDNVDITNYVFTIFGVRHIARQYMRIVINGAYYIFLGIFNDATKVPNVNCVYITGGEVHVRSVKRSNIPKANNTVVEAPENHMNGDDALLKIEIRNEDDELMVVMKSLIIEKGVTVGEFKRLYGEERKTDMNNDKSRLENKETLSWNKFKYLLELLGHKYDLLVYASEDDNK